MRTWHGVCVCVRESVQVKERGAAQCRTEGVRFESRELGCELGRELQRTQFGGRTARHLRRG